MNRLSALLALPVLLFGCGTPEVQEAAPAPGATTPAAPAPLTTAADGSLQLSELGLFFGQVCAGEQVTRPLTITNVGEDPVRVTALRLTGAGFSLPGRPALPFTLQPGQRRELRVRFTAPDSRLAPFDGNLRIVSNDDADPALDVPLTGLALPGSLRVTPRQHDFGTVPDGGSRSVQLTLRTDNECPVTLSDTRLSGQLSSALTLGRLPGKVEPGETESFTVRLRCDGQDDFLSATLRFLDEDNRAVGSSQLIGYCSR